MARLADVAGLGDAGDSTRELSLKFIEGVKALNRALDIPETITEIRESDVQHIARSALKEAHPEYPVPRFMTLEECEAIVRKLMN